MTKEDKISKKKLTEGKQASKSADKKKQKNAVKQAADKMLIDMSKDLPAGGLNELLKAKSKLDKIRAEKKILNAAEREVFANLKEKKVNIKGFRVVYAWSNMEPGDVKAEKATVALYSDQMKIELSPEDKKEITEINQKRDESRKAMAPMGGSRPKEIGSGTTLIGHNSGEEEEEKEKAAVPAKNTAINLAASNNTH